MNDIQITSFPVAPLGCNCVILHSKKSNEAIVIDPGGEGPRIIEQLQKMGARLKHIIHTHAHFDHILGLDDVYNHFSHGDQVIKTGLHKGDEMLFKHVESQCRLFQIAPVALETRINHWIEDNERISIGDSQLEILHTPGHTPGSCSFYLDESQLLFSGDTLFSRSIGRTDLPGGDTGQILKSIRERIFTLDDSTQIIPGHGPATRVYEEKHENPFF